MKFYWGLVACKLILTMGLQCNRMNATMYQYLCHQCTTSLDHCLDPYMLGSFYFLLLALLQRSSINLEPVRDAVLVKNTV